MWSHATRCCEARNVLAIDVTPDTPGLARRVTLQKRAFVISFAQPVDPAPTQDDLQRFGGSHRRLARVFFIDAQPELGLAIVMFAQPALELRRRAKALDLFRIGDDLHHTFTARDCARLWWPTRKRT